MRVSRVKHSFIKCGDILYFGALLSTISQPHKMSTSFKSISNFSSVSNLFPFFSGWMSLLMFDQGHKIKKASETDVRIKLTVMALLTLSYIHDVMTAIWVFTSYFIVRIFFWDVLEKVYV